MYIDHSVYPDLDEPPTELNSNEEKADYVHRICAAWDFGVHPEQETFDLFEQWKEVFDLLPIVTSPAYRTFRAWFGWTPVEVPLTLMMPTPQWMLLDALEERPPDPCDRMI